MWRKEKEFAEIKGSYNVFIQAENQKHTFRKILILFQWMKLKKKSS